MLQTKSENRSAFPGYPWPLKTTTSACRNFSRKYCYAYIIFFPKYSAETQQELIFPPAHMYPARACVRTQEKLPSNFAPAYRSFFVDVVAQLTAWLYPPAYVLTTNTQPL